MRPSQRVFAQSVVNILQRIPPDAGFLYENQKLGVVIYFCNLRIDSVVLRKFVRFTNERIGVIIKCNIYIRRAMYVRL